MTHSHPILNGLRGRCPKCGKGHLFASYLRIVQRCERCGERLGDIQADDGPAFFAMFLASFLCVPIGLALGVWGQMGAWALVVVLSVAALGFTLMLLPPVKGAMVGVMWRHGLTGNDRV